MPRFHKIQIKKFLYLLLLTLQTIISINAKIQPPDQSRIINGRLIEIREAPFMVQLVTKYKLFQCGGTILTQSHIVTAAHCLTSGQFEFEDLRIIANSTFMGEGELLEIERAFIHPKYSGDSYNKDVAVLQLKKPLVFGKGIGKVVKLCSDSLKDGDKIEIFGWGATGKSQYSEHLQFITSKAMSFESCKQKIKYDLTRDMMCASVENRKDACNGDSGGPAIYNGKLCGIVSWGRKCGSHKPGVYTDIVRVRGFIGHACKGNLSMPYMD